MQNRLVNTKFWADKYIVTLTPETKLLFLYFLTNPLANIAGIYELTIRQIIFDTGLPAATITKSLRKFQDDKKIYYLIEHGWVYLKNFQKHQALNNSFVAAGIVRVFRDVPGPILDEFEKLDKEFAAMRRSPEEQLAKIQKLRLGAPVKGMR